MKSILRAFATTNSGGISDVNGTTEKLDSMKSLGCKPGVPLLYDGGGIGMRAPKDSSAKKAAVSERAQEPQCSGTEVKAFALQSYK